MGSMHCPMLQLRSDPHDPGDTAIPLTRDAWNSLRNYAKAIAAEMRRANPDTADCWLACAVEFKGSIQPLLTWGGNADECRFEKTQYLLFDDSR